jgi:peptidoglycan/xylan/chitin deacetylase (PgdA/CDA1 family)
MLMKTRPDRLNALTIDVEDYFQVSAFAPYIQRRDWDQCECRVERNVDRILAILAEEGAQATFFTLGWVAQRYPQMVRRIVEQGHELAPASTRCATTTTARPTRRASPIRCARA